MKRFAVPLIVGGSLAVLIALGALLRSLTGDARAVNVTSRPPTPSTAPAPEIAPPAPSPTRSAPVPQLPSATGSTPRPRDEAPRPVPEAANDNAPPGTRLNTKNLQYGQPQLREKIAANAPAIASCVQASGTRPTGNATLTFIVADRAGRIIVEQTDIDHDATTLADEALLECFTKATSGIQFDGLPREAPAIVVTRTIALQDGTVVDDRPSKFSYLR